MKIKELYESLTDSFYKKPTIKTLKQIKLEDRYFKESTKKGLKIRKYKKFK